MFRKVVITLIILLFNSGKCEIFTATHSMMNLLNTQVNLIQIMEKYIRAEDDKLQLLQGYVHIFKDKYKMAFQQTKMYIGNPSYVVSLSNRLIIDWHQVLKLIRTGTNIDYLNYITQLKNTFPTDEDLNGAAVALTRLQETYRINISSLAQGELNGVKYGVQLNAADCYELGYQSFINRDFYQTLLWMREGDFITNQETNGTEDKNDIMKFLTFSTYKEGHIPLARDLLKKLLNILFIHYQAFDLHHKKLLQAGAYMKKAHYETEYVDHPSKFDQYSYSNEYYHKLCRGEVTIPQIMASKLKCRYFNTNSLFLLIAPFKLEEVYLDPDIYLFHDVMGDSEIEMVKRLADPLLSRALVHDPKNGGHLTANYRVSKSAWLKRRDHKYVADIAQRVTDMTGLTMETAEQLQVANYGIGGQYEPHFDFLNVAEWETYKGLNPGNRIATVLFYMSDVSQGGATVFTSLGLTLWPKKGTAVFWYNLHSNGDVDKRTRHAACPVLTGSKWVSTKWINERGQEFLKPCELMRPQTY